MTYSRRLKACAPLALAVLALSLLSAATPEAAATALFRACATKSPRHFVQHLLLGVCDGPVNTLNKYAESLHTTTYSNGEDTFTVYDLPKLMKKDTERAVVSQEFDSEDEDVVALERQMMSTYYGRKFQCVEVAGEDYDGREYRSRVVVAMIKDRWYAMPRCRSSKSFYQIADAMRLTSPESDDAK